MRFLITKRVGGGGGDPLYCICFFAAARPHSSAPDQHCGNFKQSQLMFSLYEKLLPQLYIMKLQYLGNHAGAAPDTGDKCCCCCWWCHNVRCLIDLWVLGRNFRKYVVPERETKKDRVKIPSKETGRRTKARKYKAEQ